MSSLKLFNFTLERGGVFTFPHSIEVRNSTLVKIKAVKFSFLLKKNRNKLDYEDYLRECSEKLGTTSYTYVYNSNKELVGLMSLFSKSGQGVNLGISTDWELLRKKIGFIEHKDIQY